MSVKIFKLGGSGDLSGYVPYTGATQDVDLGAFGLKANDLQFDITPSAIPTGTSTMAWDVDDETIQFEMAHSVIQRVGQETFYYAKNQTGSTITKGTCVMANGTLGNSGRILIEPMVADGSYPANVVMGCVADDILDGEDGYVTAFGKIRQIDTSSFSDGTILYCDPNNAGQFTSTQPTAPNVCVTIAIVIKADLNNGSVFVRPSFLGELNQLTNVSTGTLIKNDILQYDSANKYFRNRATKWCSTTDGTSVSGTASATITLSQLIPANSFAVGDIIRVRARFRKTTLNGNSNFIISVNTTNSLVGATSLALMTANTRFAQMKRDFYIKTTTNTESYPSAVAVTNDDNAVATAVSTSNIDWSIAQYLIFSITQGATDTAIGSGYSIEKVWGTT
jgi:hypothetical protein